MCSFFRLLLKKRHFLRVMSVKRVCLRNQAFLLTFYSVNPKISQELNTNLNQNCNYVFWVRIQIGKSNGIIEKNSI